MFSLSDVALGRLLLLVSVAVPWAISFGVWAYHEHRQLKERADYQGRWMAEVAEAQAARAVLGEAVWRPLSRRRCRDLAAQCGGLQMFASRGPGERRQHEF